MDASTLTHAHVARYLGQHCPSRWPVCTAVIALMLGLTVNSFSPSPATRLLGRMATAACTFEDDGARRQSQGSSGVSAYGSNTVVWQYCLLCVTVSKLIKWRYDS